MRRAVQLTLWLALAASSPALAVELRFDVGASANLFWMVDQISQWDERYTDPAYRIYWEAKLGGLNDADYAQIDQYVRLRRRLARLSESDVKAQTSPWSSLLGSGTLLPHEQFALAFFEASKPGDAVALLKLSQAEQDLVINTLKHFAARMKDHYAKETAHLKDFAQKATILVSLADAGGYIDQMKSFLGVTQSIPQTIPVNVLWSPPGFVRPAHMDYHIVLPVPADKAETDEAVLQQLSVVVQEAALYLFGKMPADLRSQAGNTFLRECGLVDARQPELIREALQVALGEVLFLRERFADLPHAPALAPWNPAADYPYAVDELARLYAEEMRPSLNQSGAFFPGFVLKAIEVTRLLFPPQPRFFASTALLIGDPESIALFDGLFPDVDRLRFGLEDGAKLVKARQENNNRALFVVVTEANEKVMYQVLKDVMGSSWGKLAGSFQGLRKSSYLFPLVNKGVGTVYAIRGIDKAAVRKLLLEFYRSSELPGKPVVVQ